MAPILSRAIRNARAMMRSQEFGDSSIPPNSSAPFAGALPGSAESTALAISTVLSCNKALYDDMSVLTFKAYSGDRFGAHSAIKSQPRIVQAPFGDDLDPSIGFGQLTVSRSMRGNAYAYVVSTDADGLPEQLLILHPDSVKPTVEKGRKVLKVGAETFSTQEIIHIPGMVPAGAVEGVDVITAQRMNLDLAWKITRYADGFFSSGGSPSGVITAQGSGDRKTAREIQETWETGHGGVANAHRPAVLFGGATWQQISVTPENAQFLATRAFLREEVCGMFSVPLQRIQAVTENASQGGGKGLDAIDAGYVKHGLLPIATAIERAFDRMVPGGERTFCLFDFDVFLRASAEVRATVAQAHRVGGVRTIDEIRADEGWAPLPDGQGTDPFAPLNSNTTSPAGGADNAPAPGGQGGDS